MSSKAIVSNSTLKAIADSVRKLASSDDTYTPTEMSAVLDGLDCVVILERSTSNYPLKVDASHTSSRYILPYQFGAPSAASNTYSKMTDIKLSERVQSISNYAFYTDAALTGIILPTSLSTIGVRSFAGCSSLSSLSFGNALKIIGSNAFQNCTSLTTVQFDSGCQPTSIDSSAFQGCTALTQINVPWSEGSVSGAPWGAANADISYNVS